ncbi:MAG: hypothetical protein KTR14_03750 [Vampirovibrio sp.]|nr:hypothetical protein [Vampirovibrio sp.]
MKTKPSKILSENIRVLPDISRVNGYLQKAKEVAIKGISPVYADNGAKGELAALSIQVEGPAKHLSYFYRLIDEANLKLS